MKINSCKELAHRMDPSTTKVIYSVYPHRLQPTHNDSTILVQWLSIVNACTAKILDNDCADTHLFPSQKI